MFYSICLKYSFNLYLGVSIAISFYTEAEQQLKAGRLMSFVVATQVEGEGDVHGSKDPLPGSAQLLSCSSRFSFLCSFGCEINPMLRGLRHAPRTMEVSW